MFSEYKEAQGIKTVYTNHKKEVVKTNRSKYLNQTIATCVLHMQINQYAASYAEVLDAETEQLFAIITRSISGTIKIAYKWDPKESERKYGVTQMLK